MICWIFKIGYSLKVHLMKNITRSLLFIPFCVSIIHALPRKIDTSCGIERADYVVIGVGTAGATVTKLLSDDKKSSVIALHSGANLTQDPLLEFSAFAPLVVVSALFNAPYYETGNTVPQSNADNRKLFWVLALPEGG